MKASNTVVAVIVIAAVLVFAYGVGLMIRHARTGGAAGRKPAEANRAATAQPAKPRVTQTKDTPEERARVKEQKAKALEKKEAATPEQAEEFRKQVVKSFEGRRGGKRSPNRQPPELPAQTGKTPGPVEAAPAKQDANAPASKGENAGAKPSTDKPSAEKPSTEKTGSESGKAGPG